jgi:hypothetical protein
MITIRLNGGLGNQMFQYAAAKASALVNSAELFIDIDEFETYKLRKFELNDYNIKNFIIANRGVTTKNKLTPQSFLIKFLKKFHLESLVQNYYYERTLLFDEKVLKLNDKTYMEGFFQCEKYFSNIRDLLIEEFSLKKELSKYSQFIKNEINQTNNSVSLHIRRGDYISSAKTNSTHGVCDLKYYNDGIRYLNEHIGIFTIFVFSDDILWAKENLRFKNLVFIDSSEKRIAHEDIYLMSLCDCNIIANSSFSWWGAWLNQNRGKIVIAPKKWFLDSKKQDNSKDIIPNSWIKI